MKDSFGLFFARENRLIPSRSNMSSFMRVTGVSWAGLRTALLTWNEPLNRRDLYYHPALLQLLIFL